MLVDSHCHLDFPDFAAEREAVIARARARRGRDHADHLHQARANSPGVRAIAESDADDLVLGRRPSARGRRARRLLPRAAGAHWRSIPRSSASARPGSISITITARATSRSGCSAPTSRPRAQTGLPLIVHTRDADGEIAAHPRRGDGRRRGSSIAFSSGRELAEAALELGFYISLSGIVTFKKAEELRRSCATCRSTGCWSRPTRPISRRCRIAASATSRPSSRNRGGGRRAEGRAEPRSWRAAPRRISSGCSPRRAARQPAEPDVE